MIIQAIKQNGKEKLLSIAVRNKDGKLSNSYMCDWNTVPNTLRVFDSAGVWLQYSCINFKQCCKLIFSI